MPRPQRFALALILTLLNLFAVLSNRHIVASGDVDFRALYAAGTILRTHQQDLYTYQTQLQTQNATVSPRQIALPYLYPPAAALPFAALSLLPYLPAYLIFLALNLILLVIAARLLPTHPILSFLFLPTAIALFQGQISILLLLALVAAHRALEANRPYLAGLLLAILLLKLQLALPIALLFFFWRAWPLLLGFVTGAAALTSLSLAAAGPQALHAYLQTLTTATSGTLGQYPVFSAPMPNLHGLALRFTPNHAVAVTLLLSAATLLYTALQPPSLPRATVAALLVSYHLHLHDLTLLLLPIALTLLQSLKPGEHSPRIGDQRTDHPLSLVPFTLSSVLWLLSPLHLLFMATGLNSLFAPLMLPFLLRESTATPSRDPSPEHDAAQPAPSI